MSVDPMQRLRAADPLDASSLVVLPLSELEAEWGGQPVAQRDPSRAKHRVWRGGGIVSVSIAGLVVAGAASATLAAVTGDPLGRVESVAVAPSGGTEHLARVSAMDPDGGPRWTIRIGRADPGLVCLNVGQVQSGRLGIRGLDGVFRADAVGDGDQCAVAPIGDGVVANARTFVGDRKGGSTSVVYGIAGPKVRTVTVSYPDGAQARLPIDPDGAFVIARRGTLTETAPTMSTSQGRDRNGYYARVIPFGDPAAVARRLGRRATPKPLDPTEPVR